MEKTMNRRSVLSGIAVASMATVAAPKQGAASEDHELPSPSLLALIETHKAAHTAFLETLDREEEMEAAYFAKHPKELVVPLSLDCALSLNVRDDLDEAFQDCRARVASHYEEERRRLSSIKRLAPDLADQTVALLRTKEAADVNNFRRIVREEKKRREAFGYAQVLRDRDEASDGEQEAAMALLSYPCRTAIDGRTRAEYILAGGRKSLGRIIYDSLTCGEERFVEALLLSTADAGGATYARPGSIADHPAGRGRDRRPSGPLNAA